MSREIAIGLLCAGVDESDSAERGGEKKEKEGERKNQGYDNHVKTGMNQRRISRQARSRPSVPTGVCVGDKGKSREGPSGVSECRKGGTNKINRKSEDKKTNPPTPASAPGERP